MEKRRIEITCGSQASSLLRNKEFIVKWNDLFNRSIGSTLFQSPEFVCPWYDIYSLEWQPLVITGWNEEKLCALWLLAYSPVSHTMIHPGILKVGYNTWLALPDVSKWFLSTAWKELKTKFRFSTLRFNSIPASSLIQILQPPSSLKYSFIAQKKYRPNLKLKIEPLKNSLVEKETKIRTIGTMTFSRINKEEELERILPELIAFYDFHQETLHQHPPFHIDEKKSLFLTHLFTQASDKICITVTYLNDQIIAGMIGFISGTVVHVGLVAYCPFLSEYSPDKLHLVQLNEYLINHGYELLGFPSKDDSGNGYFANAPNEVGEVTLYRSACLCFLHKWNLINRHGASFDKIKNFLRKFRLRPGALISKIKNWFKEDRELRIYRMDRSFALNSHLDERVKFNSVEDLLRFNPRGSGQSKYDFLSSSLARLENKENVYTITFDNCLAFYCWSKKNESLFLTEVEQSFSIPEDSVVFYDAFTHPKFRKKGLYEAALQHMLHEIFALPNIKYVYGLILANNFPSRHTGEKIGSQYQSSIFWRRRFGFVKKWK